MNNKKYDYIAISRETGIAKVKNIDGEWGLVEIGKEICEPKYDYISSYKNGLALVEKKGKWGFIDIKGKEICEPKYRHSFYFRGGFAAVQLPNGKRGVINKKNKEVVKIEYDYIQLECGGIVKAEKNGERETINLLEE